MTDKASQDRCRQIVFLIDSNPSFWGFNFSAEEAANAIRLCVLKVLTYFSNYGKGKRSNLRWGYKFFSSRSLLHQFERHEFKEFSVNVFEEFENLVSKKLTESFAQHLQGSVVAQNAQDGDEFPRITKPPAGAKCISCAFTNTVHDFQWDRLDISSPVRKTRGNVNSLHGNRTKTQNVMFLLSGCPCDDASISCFTGEIPTSLTTLESLKNILMPSVLYKEFKERHICLQWVNIGNHQCEKNTTLKSLLESFVEQLGGCLIPLSAMIYSGSLSSISEDSICPNLSVNKEIKTSSIDGPLLPVKTVMDFYLAGKTSKLSNIVNITQHPLDKKLGCTGTPGLLCSSGVNDKVHCSVQLNSMFQPTVRKQNPKDSCQTVSDADETCGSPTVLWIRGAISRSCVCPTWLHPMKAYTCIGVDSTHADDSTDSASCSKEYVSEWFQELLLSLAKDNRVLVLDFIECESGLPVSGVLQPLTSICAVISVISSDFLVTFEKLLLWNDKTTMKNVRREEIPHSLISEFRSKPVSKPAGQLAHSEVFLSLTESQANLQDSDTNNARKYEAGFLDPWVPFPAVVDNEDLLWKEPKRSGNESEEEDDDHSNEAALMKKLKILYNSKESKPKSTVFKERQLPNNSKGKLGTPKKSKGKQDPLKLSANVVKKTEKDDQGSKLDQSKTQPFIEKNIRDNNSGATEEDEIMGDSNGTQELPGEIKDEVQMVKAINGICDKVIFEGANILTEVTNIMTAVSRFYENDGRHQDCVSQFLKENVLVTTSKLRQKYEGCDAVLRKEQQVREYQLQILLRTEIAVLTNADENSALVEEVTVLLRTISFVKDPSFLTVYLREVLLDRYRHSLPNFLCGVYEGLMMRPPREVLTPSKWSSDDESPVRRSVNSISSAKQDSGQPRSSGCRILTRHMSITDVPGKRREIVVPRKAKPKEKDKKKKDKPKEVNNTKGVNKKEDKTARGLKTPVKLVRRNLFTGSEGADENKSTGGVPWKRKLSEGGKKDDRRRRFHRRNTVGSLSKTAVQETPAHKQVSNALWCKQDRSRKRSCAYTEVHVLQESPLKELQAGEGLPRRSPRRHPGVVFQRSQSFYGSSASAGPLTRTKSFTGVRSRDSPKKEPTKTSETSVKKTPQKLTFPAVSPLRFSPRHKRKFSLHNLLTTAKECDQNEDTLMGRQKPTTPTRQIMVPTRSSPRLLKKRSFSCIGFSSVPFPVVEEKETNRRPPEPGLDGMDECVVLLTPIRNLLKSPVQVSRKVKTDISSSSNDHTQTHVTDTSEQFDKLPQAFDENLATPVKTVISPTVRSSPGLLKKRENSEYSKEMSAESLYKSTDSNSKDAKFVKPNSKSPSSTPENLAVPTTPIREHHLDECVVLLTPIKGLVTSPVHIKAQGVNTAVAGAAAKGSEINNLEGFPVISPTFKSSRSSLRFSRNSYLDVETGSAQSSNVAEQQRKRLLKLRKKSPMSKISSGSKGTEWFNCETEGSSEAHNISASSVSPPAAEEHCPVPQFKSPWPSHAESPVAVHLLRNRSPQNSTPLPKKGKKKCHGAPNSPAESKRLSPLNQILRQQKPKRCFSSSPADKCSREAIYLRARDTPSKDAKTRNSTQGAGAEELSSLNVSYPVAIEDNSSRSSGDVDGWLTEMEKEFDRSVAEENEATKSPPTKKRRIHKSVVFGRKRIRKDKKGKKENANSSLSSDTSFEEEDEVFLSPAIMASSLRRRSMNKTPLSESSIRVLQESPLLCNSELTVSPSSHIHSHSDLSPNSEYHNRKGRLRRKFGIMSSHNDADVCEPVVDDQEEPISFNLRKRLKLSTS